MRYIPIISLLLFLTLPLSAQKKEMSQARQWLKAGNNLDKAEQSMSKLLEDSANCANIKIWDLLYEAQEKQYAQNNEKLYLKQKVDTSSFFLLAGRFLNTALRFDSVDALPDSHGNSKPKYRKKHLELQRLVRANVFNGGSYFIGKNKWKEAYGMFDLYINSAQSNLFNSTDIRGLQDDDDLPKAAYWAVYCGYMMHDAKATLHHTYLALKDTAHYRFMLQYLAETYRIEKDTARYEQTLREGFDKFSTFPYFFPHLYGFYANRGEWSQALGIAGKALKTDSTNRIYRISKSTALFHLRRYKECIMLCDSLLAGNDSIVTANINAGLAYFNMAVDLDKKVQNQKNRNVLFGYYRKALPYLERYRSLRPDDISRWSLPLYTIYLNLNMGEKFDEIDKLMRTKGK